jgi:hypothetical protein
LIERLYKISQKRTSENAIFYREDFDADTSFLYEVSADAEKDNIHEQQIFHAVKGRGHADL